MVNARFGVLSRLVVLWRHHKIFCGDERGDQEGQKRLAESKSSRGTFRPNILPWARGWRYTKGECDTLTGRGWLLPCKCKVGEAVGWDLENESCFIV